MKKVFLLVTLLVIIFSCDTPTAASVNSDKEIISFTFRAANNPGLTEDITASVSSRRITGMIPYGVDLSTLVASFELSGGTVSSNGVAVHSGSTALDFSRTVVITVTASDGSAREYRVTISSEVDPSLKTITQFSFLAANNPSLNADYYATINGTDITLEFPAGTVVNSLIPTFRTNGQKVSVNGVQQSSGLTEQNFQNALVYRVTAKDGTTQDYNTNITVYIPSTEKELTSFSFLAANNPSLLQDYHGTIIGTNISFTLPYSADYQNLVATFITTGVEVTLESPSGVVSQVSGTTANSFEGNRYYYVFAEDNSESLYTVSVQVLSSETGMGTGATLGASGAVNIAKSNESITMILAKTASITASLTNSLNDPITMANRGYWMANSEFTNGQALEVLLWAEENWRLQVLNPQFIGFDGKTLIDLSAPTCRINYSYAGGFSVESGYENHPLTNVSVFGAVFLCNWLTEMRDGHSNNLAYTIGDYLEYIEISDIQDNPQATGYRMANWDIWEFAARYRGTNSSNGVPVPGTSYFLTNWIAPSGTDAVSSSEANRVGVSLGNTPPPVEAAQVRSLAANHLGLYDMSGNVAEWALKIVNEGGIVSEYYVIKGGSWSNANISVGQENMLDPDRSGDNIGFRIARVAD